MGYKIAILALVAINALYSNALPPCVCTRNLRPVCGSDGITYSNECLLNCQKHNTGFDLTVERDGPCIAVEQSCTCTFEYKPVCGNDGNTYPNRCSLQCKRSANPSIEVVSEGACPQEPHCVCTAELNEICGSDGNTYGNPCLLNCATAKDSTLRVQHQGRCDDSVKVVEPVPPPCICTDELNEICGSDGNTYANPCELNCATAKDSTLRVQHQGRCADCVKVVEPVPHSCICTQQYSPVQGSDGKTYSNQCELNCALARDSTRVQHQGRCAESVKVVEPVPPPCICTEELNEICGSDGTTYANPCLLNCATAKDSTLRVQHQGRCADSVKVSQVPSCACSFELNEVCGSNGITYPNPCQLNCATAQDSTLRVEHAGACVNVVNPVQGDQPQSCTCPRDMKPVCGSDGVSYNNECLLRCAGAQVSLARHGPC